MRCEGKSCFTDAPTSVMPPRRRRPRPSLSSTVAAAVAMIAVAVSMADVLSSVAVLALQPANARPPMVWSALHMLAQEAGTLWRRLVHADPYSLDRLTQPFGDFHVFAVDENFH